MSALAAWVLAASTHVKDAAGHSPTKPIPVEGAEAIAAVCSKARGAIAGATVACAAVYLVMCFRESGYNLKAIGDGGKAKGPWQIHTSVMPSTWNEAVAQYTPLLQWSAQTCKEPLAALASGSCTNKAGIDISRARMAAAKQLAIDVPYTPDPS